MATREGQLSATLIELADTLVSNYDLLDYLDLLLERCRGVLDAAAGGVLLSSGRGALAPLAASDEQMRLLELFELQNDEGPCIDSYRNNTQVYEEDLARSSRWPRFTPLALERGYGSVFAFPLRLRDQVIGALNLFKIQSGPAGQPNLDAAQAFADMATIGILQERAAREAHVLACQLQTALNSRIVIEQAKGILAERAHLDMGDSWEALRWYARNHNLHLRHVAAQVVDGTLDAGEVAHTRPPLRRQ